MPEALRSPTPLQSLGPWRAPKPAVISEPHCTPQAWLRLTSLSDSSSRKGSPHTGAALRMARHPTGIPMRLQLEDYVAAVFSATRPTPAPLPEGVTQVPDFTPLLSQGRFLFGRGFRFRWQRGHGPSPFLTFQSQPKSSHPKLKDLA